MIEVGNDFGLGINYGERKYSVLNINLYVYV